MQPIGLIAAMRMESDALLRCTGGGRRIAIGRRNGWSFTLDGHSCVLVTSGMGIRRAGEAAQNMVEAISPGLLVSFGIAGAVEPELEIGDVVLAEESCVLRDDGVGEPVPLYMCNEPVREAAEQALKERGARLYTGTAVTTTGSIPRQDQLAGLSHPILEMETSAVHQVAVRAGIPLLSIRAISDGPNAPLPFELDVIMDEDANLRYGRLAREIMRHPGRLLKSGGMLKNSKVAAENAALVLIAVLQHVNV